MKQLSASADPTALDEESGSAEATGKGHCHEG